MLISLIRDHIKTHGFISLADYMRMCLLHPEHGYYTNRTVFGSQGDFITAPEISQLFGEMIGIWALTQWQRLGEPSSFNLVELGPGRGTLMNDILRSTQHVAGFKSAVHVHMVEASRQLVKKQSEILLHYHIPKTWHDTVDSIPFDKPTLIVSNEFFDALPVRQFITVKNTWHERVITLNADDALMWSSQPTDQPGLPDAKDLPDGIIFEDTSEGDTVFSILCALLKRCTGSMIAIDYGDDVSPRFGDTVQAVRHHAYSDILRDCGEADITAHVDFHGLGQIGQKHALQTRTTTQREFLQAHGIDVRFENLAYMASEIEKGMLASGYNRLIEPDQMGYLFKVIEVLA